MCGSVLVVTTLPIVAGMLLRHKAPGFTAIASLTLALGIGACTIVFGWMQGVLVDTIPGAARPERLVVIAARDPLGTLRDTISLPDARDLAADSSLRARVAKALTIMAAICNTKASPIGLSQSERTSQSRANSVWQNPSGVGANAAL